jgi:hypothetical protein
MGFVDAVINDGSTLCVASDCAEGLSPKRIAIRAESTRAPSGTYLASPANGYAAPTQLVPP